ncbi:hypothetical protein ANN_21169 [Periplaneta americana]|uniref:Gustatory receptor n=1 Tax=Periplaneta americana TaxID=6978 RepID=A0ABQ8SFS6_PERAM|nr:hypothetical protein ANN_21169 [Periplaneta americana]
MYSSGKKTGPPLAADFRALFTPEHDRLTRFLDVTGKPLDIDFRRNIILVLLLLNVGIIYADLKQADRRDGSAFQMFIFIISYHFSCHQLLIMPITWIFYCSGVIKTVTTLSKELEKNISERGFERGEKLAKYRVLWIQLSRLTQGVGSSMGVTFGWHLLTCLMVQLFYIYYFLSEILRGNICSDISTVVVIATSFLYMECNVAYKATKMVGVDFQNMLQDLEAKYPANNPDADNEVCIGNTSSLNVSLVGMYVNAKGPS